MNLTRCNQGHFYDADRFPTCPHCNKGQSGSAPLPVPPTSLPAEDRSGQPTQPDPHAGAERKNEEAKKLTGTIPAQPEVEDIGKTRGIFDVKDFNDEPVVGWLVCISGKHIGSDFKLKAGRNFVGRDRTMDVVLSKDSTVSRVKHTVIVYEPKGNMFIMQAGESKELSYLNDNVVLSPVELKAYDIITLGETQLIFIPFCSDKFKWDDSEEEK